MSTTEKLREFGINRICLSPYKKYSRGYSEPGNIGTGYVAGLKVDAGVRDKTDDTVLDGIVSYDRAEAKNAYIGQINMETASSFTGLQGVTLGYDILRNPAVDEEKPLFVESQWDGSELPIFDAKPLQDALVEYFGTESDRRHNLVPGAMVVCANKGVTAYRPQEDRPFQAGEGYGVWSAIAISFAADGTVDSDMFIEDAGVWTKNDNEADLIAWLDTRRKAIAKSIAECGQDSHVRFARTYIGFAHAMMKPNQIGNAITVGPYFAIPVDAIPGGDMTDPDGCFDILEHLSLPAWLDAMNYTSLTANDQIKY